MKERYHVTGNMSVSLPTIRERDAAIESISFLHMGAKGMIELCGKSEPFLQPFVSIRGEEAVLRDVRWTLLHRWVPTFTATAGAYRVEGTLLAPIDERGFGVRLHLSGNGLEDVCFGLRGCWDTTLHSINESKPVDTEKNAYQSGWNHCFVMDLRPALSLFAFAPIYTEQPESTPVAYTFSKEEAKISYRIFVDAAAQDTLCVWFGLGFEEVAAATAAKEMLRQGFDAEMEKTCAWLRSRERTVGDAQLDELLNRNMFFSFFFGGGITLDTEEFALVTSRSPRYYVSAAYWDRDSLLWSFPAILMADASFAREMLLYVFLRQNRNVGVHSRYIDGTVLEPGFELDELCAPLVALSAYVERTGDAAFAALPSVEAGVERILTTLAGKRNPTVALYETFLQPTDDLRTYPYITYDNVLVWYALRRVAALYADRWPEARLSTVRAEADAVAAAIAAHCVFRHDGADMYAWSVDLKGGWDIYDEPPGSLLLLPHYGFCTVEDPVWRHTAAVIRRADYPYSFADCPIAEIGCPHAPYPWVLSISNSLLSDRKERSREHLRRCRMDNGIACESVDPYTGESRTGDAFATCAGFLAYAIDRAFCGQPIR